MQCFRVANAASASDALILCSVLLGDHDKECLAASNVKLTRTVRAKWRELGDPGKRGDDIHDVNGTGPVAAEHQHCHNLPHLSHPSLSGIRKLQVASAVSLKPEVYVMP